MSYLVDGMGGIAAVTVLIHADLLVCQAAIATPVVSTTMGTSGTVVCFRVRFRLMGT